MGILDASVNRSIDVYGHNDCVCRAYSRRYGLASLHRLRMRVTAIRCGMCSSVFTVCDLHNVNLTIMLACGAVLALTEINRQRGGSWVVCR